MRLLRSVTIHMPTHHHKITQNSMKRRNPFLEVAAGSPLPAGNSTFSSPTSFVPLADVHPPDTWNYALLIILYTLQGIPMGLSASIPFLIQQQSSSTDVAYKANAMFALCSWPFSLKLLWAPIVDACYIPQMRRKSWLVPVQGIAGLFMIHGADWVQKKLEGGQISSVTLYFLTLYACMATQDIAVDGWALELLSPANRGRGPVCNSIGQNIGYFISFVGFLALNDVETSQQIRNLFKWPARNTGLVSLQGFLKGMGYAMLTVTTLVGIFKRERPPIRQSSDDDENAELDASEIGLRETYRRLYKVAQLPAVQTLFLILLTYRLPCALSDNVKLLKAVQFGLSKSTTALLSPTIVLPLGILVPIVATHIWPNRPLDQFLWGLKLRVTLVPLLDVWLLQVLKQEGNVHSWGFWLLLIGSTASQAMANSLQFNAQMTFFASRVDPTIGGTYMTLLNTAANLGGTWPANVILWLTGRLSRETCSTIEDVTTCTSHDPYTWLQVVLSGLGLMWLVTLGGTTKKLGDLPMTAWQTQTKTDGRMDPESLLSSTTTNVYRNETKSFNKHN